jgi:PIN domain nuclease of toxin-antitoxin system
MKVLIDTHIFIWFINGDKQLPKKTREIIADTDNKCFISIASIWEIAIKFSLGKLKLKSDFEKIADFLLDNDIEILSLSFEHIQQLLKLDFHHHDPFDRIIIAQGIEEDITIITKDREFILYDVNTLWNDSDEPADLSK